MLARYRAVGEKQTAPDILCVEVGKFLQDRLCRIAGRQHAEDMLDRDPHAADNGLTPEDTGAHGDAAERFRLFGFS